MTDLHPPEDATHAYLTGQRHASHTALLAAFVAESEASVAAYGPALDVPYGAHPREVFDFYQTDMPFRGTLAYFHAGYWQSRDKAPFRFIAPGFLTAGFDVALVNYPLCPDVTLRDLVESARRSVPAIQAHGRGGAMIAAGHSAGAHLAVELALTDWGGRGLAASPVAGVVAVSGVYDLAPLLATSLNDKLRLDAAEARAMSPVHRVGGVLPWAVFAVGGAETAAFRDQNEAMQAAWRGAGGRCALVEEPGADHFSVLRALTPGRSVFEAMRAKMMANCTV